MGEDPRPLPERHMLAKHGVQFVWKGCLHWLLSFELDLGEIGATSQERSFNGCVNARCEAWRVPCGLNGHGKQKALT